MSKQLLIVEDALIDYNGHWFEQILAISDAAKEKGNDVKVVCSKNCVPEMANKLNLLPSYKSSYFRDLASRKKSFKKYFSFVFFYFDSIWSSLGVVSRHKSAIYFLPTATVHHFVIWSFVLAFYSKTKIKFLILTPPGIWNENTKSMYFPKSSLIFKTLAKWLDRYKNVELLVQTTTAKKELETYTGVQFGLVPQPVAFTKQNKSELYKNTITFGSLGYERFEKGSDILLQTIEQFKTGKTNKVNFTIQWKEGFNTDTGEDIFLTETIKKDETIKIIDYDLQPETYLSELLSIDCVILPYRNSSYYFRDSRVAIEAGIYGIPIIGTKGGWIEEFVTNYGAGICVEEGNIDEFVIALETMENNYNIYLEKARSRKSKTTSYYSADNFVKIITK